MNCKIKLRPKARKQLSLLSKRDQKRIGKVIDWLHQAGDKAHAALDLLQRQSMDSTLTTHRTGRTTSYIISLGEFRIGCRVERNTLVIGAIVKIT